MVPTCKVPIERKVPNGPKQAPFMDVAQLLCRYCKRTDIYYSTWSFESVAKISQFQFLDPPPQHTLTILGRGIKKLLDPPTH